MIAESDVAHLVATGSQCVSDGLGAKPHRYVSHLDALRWAWRELVAAREEARRLREALAVRSGWEGLE